MIATGTPQPTFNYSSGIWWGDEDGMMRVLQTVPAISIEFNSDPPSFGWYGGGICSDSSCSSTNLDHAFVVVG